MKQACDFLFSSYGAVISRVGTKPPWLFCRSGISSRLAGGRCSLPLSVASQATWNLMAALFHFDDNCFSELWLSSSRWPHCWSSPYGCIGAGAGIVAENSSRPSQVGDAGCHWDLSWAFWLKPLSCGLHFYNMVTTSKSWRIWQKLCHSLWQSLRTVA